MVANGGERPYDWQSSGFDWSTATPIAHLSQLGVPANSEGYVDENQARGWLRNVTERCASIGRPIDSPIGPTAITATATAT